MAPWRLILRNTTNGAHASSSEVNGDCIGTVPNQQAKQIKQALSVDNTSLRFPGFLKKMGLKSFLRMTLMLSLIAMATSLPK